MYKNQLTYFLFQVMVGHGTDTGVAPYILCRLNHVNDGINRQDDAQDANRSADTRHQGKGEEITAHRYTRITDGGDNRDQDPEQDGGYRNGSAAILHDK